MLPASFFRRFRHATLAVALLVTPIFSITPSVQAATGAGEGGLGSAVLSELNRARTNPAAYAALLENLRPYYAADGTRSLPGEGRVRTREGVSALDGAIRALHHTTPLPPLSASSGLARAAFDHARDQAHNGGHGHHGSDGSSPFMRMNRHGRWQSHAGECIDYGAANARRIVMNLLIDDGVRDRGHRLNILNRDFAVAGVSAASHPRFRHLCVIDFATAYVEADGRVAGDAPVYASDSATGGPSLVSPMIPRSALRYGRF
jgi:uncharacterized protein YkwD